MCLQVPLRHIIPPQFFMHSVAVGCILHSRKYVKFATILLSISFGLNEIRALLGFYEAQIGSYLAAMRATWWSHLQESGVVSFLGP